MRGSGPARSRGGWAQPCPAGTGQRPAAGGCDLAAALPPRGAARGGRWPPRGLDGVALLLGADEALEQALGVAFLVVSATSLVLWLRLRRP